MMETEKEFTQEAIERLETYISNIRTALQETELTDDEIEESLSELRYHIISNCEIRTTSNIITTDLVNVSIKKLGDPQTIAESLQSELDFSELVTNNTERNSSMNAQNKTKQRNDEGIKIKAGHLTALYGTTSWLMTAILVFVTYSAAFNEVLWLYPILYATTIGGLILTRNFRAYMYNKHLQKHIKPNAHTNIMPIIFVILGYFNVIKIPFQSIWVVPATIVIFLIIATTDYGKQYYKDLYDMIQNWDQ